MSATFYERVPEPWKDDVSRILTITVGNVAQYFKAEFLVGSIMFVIIAVGMVVIGVVTDAQLLIDFAILLGLVAFVMELIPQIGPILSYIPALILALASGPMGAGASAPRALALFCRSIKTLPGDPVRWPLRRAVPSQKDRR